MHVIHASVRETKPGIKGSIDWTDQSADDWNNVLLLMNWAGYGSLSSVDLENPMIRLLLSICFLSAAITLLPTTLVAQETGTSSETTGGDTGGSSGGAPGSQGDIGENLALETSIPEISIPDFDDNRNQGFVGVTGTNVQDFGFVGGLSQFVGGSTEGSFGGDVNTTSGAGGGGSGRGGGNTGFAGGGTANGFQLMRPKYIRTRLRVNFDAPQIPNEFISNQFSNRLNQLPAVGGSPDVNVSINNRTATITGSTHSPAAAVRIERQLRLEPGVSRVVNQLTYPGQ